MLGYRILGRIIILEYIKIWDGDILEYTDILLLLLGHRT